MQGGFTLVRFLVSCKLPIDFLITGQYGLRGRNIHTKTKTYDIKEKKMHTTKKIISTITCIILILFNPSIILANDTSTICHYDCISLQLIDDYTKSINNQDWTSYKNCFDDSLREALKNFPSKKQIEQKTGLLSVENISTAMIKEISLDSAQYIEPRFRSIDVTEYDKLYAYYIGFDIKVSKESQFFYNGVNFYLMIVGIRNGVAKITQLENAYYFDRIKELNVSFNTASEQIAHTIIDARKQGIIINAQASVLNYLSDSSKDRALNEGLVREGSLATSLLYSTKSSNRSIYNGIDEPYIKVYITDSDIVKTIPLFEYVINVLPNEWYPSWSYESLEAGCMAIKTYAWYNILNPRFPATLYDAHVTDSPSNYQHYVENSTNIRCTIAAREVQNYVMVDENYDLFDARYSAGSYNDFGESGGEMYQWGTKYLSDEYDMSFSDICQYYYPNIHWIISNNE